MHHLITPVAVMLLLSVAPWNEVHGQCGSSWTAGPAPAVNGVNGPIYASLSWDHDSVPATPNWLVVGGDFSVAGATQAYNIAAWDGTTWHKFGVGTDGPVRALAVYSGQLVLGGDFNLANFALVNHIARWNGTTFQGFESGIAGGSAPTVHALAVNGGHLYAGGLFTSAGGIGAANAAHWNGSAWSAMGDGLNDAVNALVLLSGPFGDVVIAGGAFEIPGKPWGERIATWFEGDSNWQPLGDGTFPGYCFGLWGCFYSRINSLLLADDGTLYAAGMWAGGNFPCFKPFALANFDWVAWQDMATYIDEPCGFQTCHAVENCTYSYLHDELFALTQYNGALVAGDRTGPAPWPDLGGGANGVVCSLTVHNGDLYACGQFDSAGGPGGISANNIARWNGSAWSNVTPAIGVRAMTTYGSGATALAAGGTFIWPDPPASDTIEFIASYDDETLAPLGSGTLNGTVHAAAANGASLIVGGDFVFPGEDHQLMNRVATLGGSFGWSRMGAGFNDSVYALTWHNGILFAAGAFTASGGTTLDRI